MNGITKEVRRLELTDNAIRYILDALGDAARRYTHRIEDMERLDPESLAGRRVAYMIECARSHRDVVNEIEATIMRAKGLAITN